MNRAKTPGEYLLITGKDPSKKKVLVKSSGIEGWIPTDKTLFFKYNFSDTGMNTVLRLGSVAENGVGGEECYMIDMIYKYLLHEFGQDFYNRISINLVDNEPDELVMKVPGNRIHVNIFYPVESFEKKSATEKNEIRLDIVHAALLCIAQYDNKLDVSKLEAIRKTILDNNFTFDFTLYSFVHKKNKTLIARIIVHPEIQKFDYYVMIEEGEKLKCKIHIYSGRTAVFFGEMFFCYGKWKSENEIIISGKDRIVETHIVVRERNATYINLTPYEKPPYFELMKADISDMDREKARKDFRHSSSSRD